MPKKHDVTYKYNGFQVHDPRATKFIGWLQLQLILTYGAWKNFYAIKIQRD